MKWPKGIRELRIPWGDEAKSDTISRRQESQEPESGTAQVRRRFDEVLRAIRSEASCDNSLVQIVVTASHIRIRVLIPLERDDEDAYWLQTALLDDLKEAVAHPARMRGVALRDALSEAGVQVMYLDRARPKQFGEPDWHEEARLLL